MIRRRKLVCLLVVSLLPFSATGCIVIGVGGWCWSCGGPVVWTDSVTEQLVIDTADLTALKVRTHNGSISFDGQPAGSAEAYVTVTKKAGGITKADAEKALAALDVYVEPGANGTRIGWKWKGLKHANWGARVSFEIKAPGNLNFDGKTHNGPVEIKGVVGEVRLETHNGPVTVDARDGKLYAKTHNGKIGATYTGQDITLLTHNGTIVADLSRCASLSGSLRTHNGGVEMAVGEGTSAALKCRTHNGRIKCDVPISVSEVSRAELTGTIGSGEGKLNVETHNGNVRITKTAG